MDLSFQIQEAILPLQALPRHRYAAHSGTGVDAGVIKRVVVALYEAEVNIVAHAYKGNITARIDPERVFLKLVDEGPGSPILKKP